MIDRIQPERVSAIVAMDRRGVIGKGGGLPWRLPADLKWFKRNTLGHHVIMGRVTYESVGRPLPGRTNLVVTTNPRFEAPGCEVVHSLDDALRRAADAGDAEAFVIGGAQLYALALPRCDRIYLTRVEAEVDGDTWFPAFDQAEWREVFHEGHDADAEHRYAFALSILDRTR